VVGIELGPFELKEPVGRGSTGVVYRGVHRGTGLPVAVKVLHPGAARHGAPPDAFRNEVRAIAALDHPSIIWVVAVGQVDETAWEQSRRALTKGHPYLAMEYASGGTLGDWIPPDYDSVHAMLQDLLGALAHGHARSMVHRDLKPGNVLRCTDADVRPGWKLTDFGIATNFEQTVERSLPGRIVGTLSYMSPEQIQGNWRLFGPWTDLYALGCVVYKVLAGRRPWDSVRGAALFAAHLERKPDPLRSKIPVPRGFHDWVATLMEKRPRDRFQTAAEAALALEALTQSDVDPPRRDPLPPIDDDHEPDTVVVGLPRIGRDGSGLPREWRVHELPPPAPALIGAGLSVLGERPPPFVGRGKERDALWSNLRQTASTNERHLVVIRGHRGVGKTRLARWIGQQAHELAGLPFLIGEARRGEPPEMATARPLRRWLHTERLNPEERLLRIRDTFPDESGEWQRDLNALLGDDPAGELGELGERTRHLVLGQALSRLGDASRPNVLVLDDAQTSADLLRFVLHLVATPHQGAATLIVVVLQEEGIGTGGEIAPLAAAVLQQAETIDLAPLPEVDLARLIQGLLPMESTVAAQLAERTGGNPLHAYTVLQDWAHAGVLALGAGGFELSGEMPEVPPLRDVWQRRVESLLHELPEGTEEQLERAATLGLKVNELEWQRVCDDPKAVYAESGRVLFRPDLAALRGELRDRLLALRLADDSRDGWAFANEMFREAILRRAARAGRLASHHRACARMLLHLEASHQYAERIGRHLLAGERAEWAIPQLLEGIRQRRRQSGDAATLPLLAEVERALRDAGVPASERAWAELWALRADVFIGLGRLRDAERWAQETLARARDGQWPDLSARALWVAARVLVEGGDPEAADSLLAEAETLLGAAGDAALRGEVHATRSRCARMLGEIGVSRGHARLAAQALTEAGERTPVGEAWRVLGEDALADGNLDEAQRYLDKALARHRNHPLRRGVVEVRLGQLAQARGDLDLALQCLDAAIDHLRQAGSGRVAEAWLALARLHLARRDWGEAGRVAGNLVRRLTAEHAGPMLVSAHTILAAAAAGTRDWPSLDRSLDRLLTMPARHHDPSLAAVFELAIHRTETAGEAQRAKKVRRVANLFREPERSGSESP